MNELKKLLGVCVYCDLFVVLEEEYKVIVYELEGI